MEEVTVDEGQGETARQLDQLESSAAGGSFQKVEFESRKGLGGKKK